MDYNQIPDQRDIVEIINGEGKGNCVLLCEHASNYIPPMYDNLELKSGALESHAVWDIGALSLAKLLAVRLDSPLVASKVSRLVYDCNRAPDQASAIPQKSELIDIPGNHNISDDERRYRINTVYEPFCEAAEYVVEHKINLRRPTFLLTIHSFSPIYFGKKRDVEIGILHGVDKRLADLMLEHKAHALPFVVSRNEPYCSNDNVFHSIKTYGLDKGIPNVMIEVRNDLLLNENKCAKMASVLMKMIEPAIEALKKS